MPPAAKRPSHPLDLAEAFLRCLGSSDRREELLLTGDRLLAAWLGSAPPRANELELRWTGPDDAGLARQALQAVCDSSAAKGEHLAGACLQPVRGRSTGLRFRLEAVRSSLELALSGAGPVCPSPVDFAYPCGAQTARVPACPRETVAAESFAELLSEPAGCGLRTHLRLWLLAHEFPFDGASLGQALEIALRRRRLPLPSVTPRQLEARRNLDSDWRALTALSSSSDGAPPLAKALELVRELILTPLPLIAAGLPVAMTWPPGGPWRRTGFWRYG